VEAEVFPSFEKVVHTGAAFSGVVQKRLSAARCGSGSQRRGAGAALSGVVQERLSVVRERLSAARLLFMRWNLAHPSSVAVCAAHYTLLSCKPL